MVGLRRRFRGHGGVGVESVVGGLDELAVADDLTAEILVERVEHPFPVVAAVILPPSAAEDVARGIFRRLGEEPLQAVEVARGHFLGGFHIRPQSREAEAFEEAFRFLLR